MQLHEKLHENAEFQHVLSLLPAVNMTTGPWITGGAARRLWQGADWHVGDVDVFFVNDQQRLTWLAEFNRTWINTQRHVPELDITQVCELRGPTRKYSRQKPLPQAHLVMDSSNALTFELYYQLPGDTELKTCKLQVIKVRYAQSLHDLWKSFDFNVCCFAADAQKAYADPAALVDLHDNAISVRYHVASINLPLRVFKHFSQGYHVDDELIKKAMRQIADKEVDWCNNY